MISRQSYLLVLIFSIVIVASCGKKKSDQSTKGGGVRLAVTYAMGFIIVDHSAYYEVILRDPLDTVRIIDTYYLLKKGEAAPFFLRDKQVTEIPADKVACMSTTHLGFLEKLELRNRIIGAAGTKYIYDRGVRDMADAGQIKEIGTDAAVNYELIAKLEPDVFLCYSFGADGKEMIEKLSVLGAHPVVLNEYQELTPLGQAEWIKLVGLLCGEYDQACSIFEEIAKRYNNIREQASGLQTKPTVITGLPFRGEWTVPGGKSFAAHYISDAHAEYIWSDNELTFNFPVSLEQVILKGHDADIWMNISNVQSKDEIIAGDQRMAALKAFQAGQLYNNNRRVNEKGGNDYWESGIVNPDYVLDDLVHIFHPEIGGEYEFHFYKKIE